MTIKNYSNGSIFIGDNMTEGNGLFISCNNNFYEGDFSNNKLHGNGVLSIQNGFYSGEFKEGEITGTGTWVYLNGTVYDGSFYKNKPHGYGKRTFENGDCYEGGWYRGTYHGFGKYTFYNGGYFEGHFDKGIKSGSGKLFFVKKSIKGNETITYLGDWVDDKFHCEGGIVIRDNISLIANWKKGNIKGIATVNINNEIHNIDFDDKSIYEDTNIKRILIFFNINTTKKD